MVANKHLKPLTTRNNLSQTSMESPGKNYDRESTNLKNNFPHINVGNRCHTFRSAHPLSIGQEDWQYMTLRAFNINAMRPSRNARG